MGLVNAKEVAQAINIDKLGLLGTVFWLGFDENLKSRHSQ